MNTAFSGLQQNDIMSQMGGLKSEPFGQIDQNVPSDCGEGNGVDGVDKNSKGIKKVDRENKMSSFLARRRKGLGKSGKLTKGKYLSI